MKSKFALLPLVLLSVSAIAQNVGGCISHFAENYDPNATFNDGSCNYDLQQLLNDGFELGDLLSSGVVVDELIGLFGAGGFIVDIDVDQDQVLLAWPHASSRMTTNCESFTRDLKTYMFFDQEFGVGVFDGRENWDKIRRNYSYRYPGYMYYDFADNRNAGWSTSGCSNWFVPTEAALLLYKEVCQSKYGGASYDSMKDYDPNAGTANVSLNACGGHYPFNTEIWTSEPTNLSSEWIDATVEYKTINLNGVTSINETIYNRAGNNYKCIFPMGVSEIRTVGTINNCNDWSYNGSPNYASQIGLPCNYPFFECQNINDPNWENFNIGLYPAGRTLLDLGTDQVRSLQLKLPATLELIDNGETNVYPVAYFEIDSIGGVPPGLTLNYNVGDQLEGGMVHCLEWSGAAVLGGRYDLSIKGTYYVPILGSLYPYPTTETYTHNFGVVEFIEYTAPDDTSSAGCTYVGADNYDPQATIDDGSCTYQGICPGDLDADGIIGVMDILELLGLYDTTCD